MSLGLGKSCLTKDLSFPLLCVRQCQKDNQPAKLSAQRGFQRNRGWQSKPAETSSRNSCSGRGPSSWGLSEDPMVWSSPERLCLVFLHDRESASWQTVFYFVRQSVVAGNKNHTHSCRLLLSANMVRLGGGGRLVRMTADMCIRNCGI